MRADLWRYVLLCEYGGIYSDVDTYPNTTFVLPHDVDAYFVLEGDGLLSQYFMAVAPHHPLLFYTIQHAVANLLEIQGSTKRLCSDSHRTKSTASRLSNVLWNQIRYTRLGRTMVGFESSIDRGWNLYS